MDQASKQQGIHKENSNTWNTYTQNQEETTEFLWTHNEEGRHGKLNSHEAY